MIRWNKTKGAYETIIGPIRRLQDKGSTFKWIYSSWEDRIKEPFEYEDKKDGFLAYPAEYPEDTTNVNKESVESIYMLILDFDESTSKSDLEYARNMFDNYYYFYYTSFRNSSITPKYKICIPLANDLDKSWVLDEDKKQTIIEWKNQNFIIKDIKLDMSEAGRYGGTYLPSKKTGTNDYEYYIHDSQPLFDFEAELKKLAPTKEITKRNLAPTTTRSNVVYTGTNKKIQTVYDWIEHASKNGNNNVRRFFDGHDIIDIIDEDGNVKEVPGEYVNYISGSGGERNNVTYRVLCSAIGLNLSMELIEDVWTELKNNNGDRKSFDRTLKQILDQNSKNS